MFYRIRAYKGFGFLALVGGGQELALQKYEEAEILLTKMDNTDEPSIVLKKAIK